MHLTTVDGKQIQITKAEIEITRNRYISSGYAVSLCLTGILPKCRKKATLTTSWRSNTDEIGFTTLHGYRDHHVVKKSELARFVATIPVVTRSYMDKDFVVLPEHEAFARNYIQELYLDERK